MLDFLKSLRRIRYSTHCSRRRAVKQHLRMIVRRIICSGPISLSLSNSVIYDETPSPTIMLVNSLGMYDFNNMSLARQVLGEGGTFVDVGANIGCYSVLISECDLVDVISFEPVRLTYDILKKNIALNSRHNITAFNLALSDKDGEVRMTKLPVSTINRVVSDEVDTAWGDTDVVEAKALSSVVGSNCLKPIVIKIDVEGHELSVLKGGGLALSNAALVFVERGERQDVRAYMETMGFFGPWYWDQRRASFRKTPLDVEEDAVFVGQQHVAGFPLEVAAG